ncbi:MFS transporter [Adlercreutzia sp. ZJ304]|uniref:MFS transporter n=1 Tax=Adlercreutzia sp. ZJ304 TaxID=2709791 RepID=UPI0013EDBEF9|nr:MFS transporter [Adlercreutzia sp. ZJ304]
MASSNTVDKSAYGNNKLAQWGIANDQMTKLRKWLCFWVLFAFGATCVYQWQMMAPVIAPIAEVFGIDPANMGFLMSVYTIAGLILAYPCTWLMQHFGIKFSLLVTAVLAVLGNLICLFAVDSTVFLVGRAIQGCGFGLIAVLGPNIMPRLFPLEEQGLVMGIWSQWVTPGIAMGALSTPILFQAFGWQSIFYLSTVLTVITTILLIIFVQLPLVPENLLREDNLEKEDKPASAKKIYVRDAVIVGFGFVAWATVYGCYNSFFPTYLQQTLGMDLMSSSMTTLVTALVTIPSGIFIGWLADKIRQRKLILIIGYICTGILFAFFIWQDAGSVALAWTCAVLLGFICAGIVPTMTRAIIPVLAQRPKQTDWALTGMAFVTQLGSLIATFFATVMVATSWGTAGMVYGIIGGLVGLASIVFVKNDHNIDV